MEYSLGMANELNNYVRQSSSRREALYLLRSTDDLQRYFSKMKADYDQKINELQRRLDDCMNYQHLVERIVDSRESRNKKEGLSLNLERYEDLLECNFKEIQWTRSSRMNEDDEGGKFRKIDAIQAEVSRLEQFIMQRESEHQKNLKELQHSVEEQMKHIDQNFEEKSLKYKQSVEQHHTEITQFEQSFSQNLLQLQQVLNQWNTSLCHTLQTKIETIESQLHQLNTKK